MSNDRFLHETRDCSFADAAMAAMQNEIRRLRRWKVDAMSVLNMWDDAYERADITGLLGRRKPDLMVEEIQRLRAALNDTTPGAGTGSPTGNDNQQEAKDKHHASTPGPE